MTIDRLLPLSIVAKRCSVHKSTVLCWCHDGKVEFTVLPGGHFRVRESELERLTRANGKDHIDSLLEQ